MYLIGFVLVLIANICMLSARWAVNYFGLASFSQLIYHIKVPLDGTNIDVLYDWMKMCLVPSIFATILIEGAFFFLIPEMLSLFSLLILIIFLYYALHIVGFFNYVNAQIYSSNLYETKYVDPKKTEVKFSEKKNLIHIYLESMENTHAPRILKGNSKEVLIPELTSLAFNNISFSNTGELGGAKQVISTGWTTAGLVGSSSGLPINLSINAKKYNRRTDFMVGAYSLGDFLRKEGYNQEFLCGSDANFGGRSYYYVKHGDFKIYDLYTARENNDIDKDYKEFWGFEDQKLFDIAKKELTRLSKEEEPFNFTMLTVDTHHPNGYICSQCGKVHKEDMKNILLCNSKQVGSFVEWIKLQPFYENTVIVLNGDHLSMAANFINRTYDSNYERTTYNVFINTGLESSRQKNRNFCVFDYYPTILASMGAKIEGDRLGFGTNLFSDKKTLIEEMGFDSFNKELAKRSKFYNRHIL